MKKIVDIINNLTNLLPLKPASDNEITDAELQLGLSFAEEYKDYLAEFGAIMADGIELSGIAKAEQRNVVILTKKEWNLNPKVPNTMYVIENTYVDGIIIWQNMKGIIYQTQPNTEPRKIADSMAEYISNRK